MQRVNGEIEIDEIDILICDEDCLPYREAGDDKDDEEWDMETGEYKKPLRTIHRRRFVYNASAIGTFLFAFFMIYWSYDVMYNNMDYDESTD